VLAIRQPLGTLFMMIYMAFRAALYLIATLVFEPRNYWQKAA
jgi:hypothetical protein